MVLPSRTAVTSQHIMNGETFPVPTQEVTFVKTMVSTSLHENNFMGLILSCLEYDLLHRSLLDLNNV